jgi:hypothetical protein
LVEFALLWLAAIASLGLALLLMSFYFRILGSDLSLNSVPKEVILAIVVSAIQAGCVWFVLPFAQNAPWSFLNRGAIYLIPGVACVLLYRLAHLADWDQYESPGLPLFQFVIVLIAAEYMRGDFRLGLLVSTGFVTILLIIGAFAKQTGG